MSWERDVNDRMHPLLSPRGHLRSYFSWAARSAPSGETSRLRDAPPWIDAMPTRHAAPNSPLSRRAKLGATTHICLLIGALLLTACATPQQSASTTEQPSTSQPIPPQRAPLYIPAAPESYQVVPGDSLYRIAQKFDLDFRCLALHNAIEKPFLIFPGQQITLVEGHCQLPTRPPVIESSKAKSSSNAETDKKSAQTTNNKEKQHPDPKQLRWHWPARGSVIGHFDTSRADGQGIKIAGKVGQPILAAAAGRVVYSGSGLVGLGELIIIKHDARYLSAYAQNKRLLVNEGAQVKAGETIAEMGNNGSDRAMLHFEIRKSGKPVDPLDYLPASNP